MDSLRIQAAEGKKADFTEPCKNCPDIESCNCDCSTTTKKIADEAGYNTDLVGGTINLYRMKSMEVIVNENEKGMSLDIKTKCPVKLREPGTNIEVDGIWGKMTTAQLKRYWKRLGWSTAGSYCGKKTCKALYANRKK